MENAVNSVPCNHCGKYHTTSFKNHGTIVAPSIVYGFSDDACDAFKKSVKEYVSSILVSQGYSVTVL